MNNAMIQITIRKIEHGLFVRRRGVIAFFSLITALFGWAAISAHLEGGIEKHVPTDHPYLQIARKYEGQAGSGSTLLVALQVRKGETIFSENFFEEFRLVADDLFYLPGVDKANVTDLFTPNVRTVELTEDGFAGSALLPDDFKPTPLGFAQVKHNLLVGGFVGRLISSDFTTAMIVLPVMAHAPGSAAPLDYLNFARRLETDIKQKYELRYPDVRIRITGAIRAAGEIADGFTAIAIFFLLTLLITTGLLYAVSRQWWLTFAPLLCSLAAVVWQVGAVTLLGYSIDLYSVFIPFLVLAIGVSHGVQMILSAGQLVATGASPVEAARHSFHRLFAPGAIALVTAVMTFLAITTIRIPVIRELALTATIGVGALAFTNLLWLPLLLSYAKIGEDEVLRMRAGLIRRDRFWYVLAVLVHPRYALLLSLGAALLAAAAATAARDLVVGDLQQGAAELRPDSRFNQDTADLLSRFGNGADSLQVFAVSTEDSCLAKKKMDAIDEFVETMRFVPGVHGTLALSSAMKNTNAFLNEGNIRWAVISRNHYVMGQSSGGGGGNRSLTDTECSVMPLYFYLDDHRAATLTGVIGAVRAYQAAHPDLPIALKLAGGNGGQAAATNEVVSAAQFSMLSLVYLAVIVICGAVFRSVRAVICIIVPLALVSLIANGAMAALGIGLKVSTLPIAALGVGIGVDYGIYKFSRLRHYMHRGMSLQDAYIQTLRETGSAVIFTGLTLSIGVATWVLSPLQFQADMGLLLTLMFFANMIGAIFLLPSLIGIMQILKPERLTAIGEPPVQSSL